MRFNHKEVQSIMPEDSKYVTIVREPLALFESSFDYFYGIVPSFQKIAHGTSVEAWLDHAEEYVNAAPRQTYTDLEKNLLFFDFGYDNRNEEGEYIANGIAEIDETFDLVMISDYMDESLVLLSELMCWELDELACLKLNARASSETRPQSDINRIRKKVRVWNKADAAIFDYFNATFWRKVEEFGPERMKQRVEQLHNASLFLKQLCLNTEEEINVSEIQSVSRKKNIFAPKGVKMTGYDLKPGAEKIKLCQQLAAAENPFSMEIFNYQKLSNVKSERETFVANAKYIDVS